MPQNIAPSQVLDAVRASPGNRVKVAVSDIDGVLRGKYLHKDKFFSDIFRAARRRCRTPRP